MQLLENNHPRCRFLYQDASLCFIPYIIAVQYLFGTMLTRTPHNVCNYSHPEQTFRKKSLIGKAAVHTNVFTYTLHPMCNYLRQMIRHLCSYISWNVGWYMAHTAALYTSVKVRKTS